MRKLLIAILLCAASSIALAQEPQTKSTAPSTDSPTASANSQPDLPAFPDPPDVSEYIVPGKEDAFYDLQDAYAAQLRQYTIDVAQTYITFVSAQLVRHYDPLVADLRAQVKVNEESIRTLNATLHRERRAGFIEKAAIGAFSALGALGLDYLLHLGRSGGS